VEYLKGAIDRCVNRESTRFRRLGNSAPPGRLLQFLTGILGLGSAVAVKMHTPICPSDAQMLVY